MGVGREWKQENHSGTPLVWVALFYFLPPPHGLRLRGLWEHGELPVGVWGIPQLNCILCISAVKCDSYNEKDFFVILARNS